ncbi:flagellar basal body rod protein FlgB [Pseudochelatococcus sp. G4_1912]|uniref:flagellar basal body rod protein FlgB n=1 Tax=Pseudochelatococcus sp. G4_1912 TaxID=3114288 RepID=UPI0039C640D3
MDPIFLFDLASKQANWLTSRQAVLSRNVANANTPGFRAQDIEPFSATMDKTALEMTATSSSHLGTSSDNLRTARPRNDTKNNWGVFHSGNSVNIEEEMLKAGEVSRQYSLNTSIVKSFHKFILTSARGPG